MGRGKRMLTCVRHITKVLWCGTRRWTQHRRKAVKLEVVTQLTAALFTGSALFIARIIQQGTRERGREREKGGGIMAALILWILWALLCKMWPHTHIHSHTHFDNVSWAHSLYQRPHHAGINFCSWLHEKRENFMMFISLWLYLTPVLLWGKCARCVWRLFRAPGVASVCWWDVCLTDILFVYAGCFFNLFHWKCSHLLLCQTAEVRICERGQ